MISIVIAILLNIVNKNFDSLSVADAEQITALMRRFDEVLAIMPEIKEDVLEPDLQDILDRRQAARVAKDWATADALKAELIARGIEVKDTPNGPVWKRV